MCVLSVCVCEHLCVSVSTEKFLKKWKPTNSRCVSVCVRVCVWADTFIWSPICAIIGKLLRSVGACLNLPTQCWLWFHQCRLIQITLLKNKPHFFFLFFFLSFIFFFFPDSPKRANLTWRVCGSLRSARPFEVPGQLDPSDFCHFAAFYFLSCL